MKRGVNYFLLLFFMLVVFVSVVSFVSATANCWEYDDETSCESVFDSASCVWHDDGQGGWCEELNCWSLWSQTDCENSTLTSLIGKDCQWKLPSSTYGWCEQVSCWSFKATNQTTCENNSAGLNCRWDTLCSGYNPNTNCWDLSTESTCENVTGCYWGECVESANCWEHYASDSCTSATGANGNSCAWNSQYNYCYEKNCWDYSGTNESYCTTQGASLNCTWIDNYYIQDSCENPACYHYDKTNQSACEGNTKGLDCEWDGEWCNEKGCWNYPNQTVCMANSGCAWSTSTSQGWCEEVQCWSWDSTNGGDADSCVNNTYDLSCAWDSNGGWCYPDIETSCSNFTTEKSCMDTYYCWWEYTDWMDISLGGTCKDPMWGGDYGEDDDFFDEWNPGCYVFDMNSTDCNNVIGCNYTSGFCDPIDENSSIVNVTASYIEDNGLNCSMINNSVLCNNVPVLSTCCEWNAGQCQVKLGDTCWQNAEREQQELGGVQSCGDVSMLTSDTSSAKSLCQEIAAFPLYMPCEWNNDTKSCDFKSDKVFGNQTQSFALIDNKKTCNAAGGKWVQEWYCEGNVSVPAGRCEQKGKADERNCDKACFACEYKFDGSAHNSSQAAKQYCYSSALGYCQFINDSSAPNGYGYCKAKEEFKKGIATDCKSDCGSCTYYGNPYAASYSSALPPAQPTYDTCNTPECYCEHASEFNNVNCKWVSDSTSDLGGYCASSSEKTCADSCDRCYTRTTCLNDGRSAFGAGGSCDWSSDSETDGACTKNTGGDGISEICWDGIDNDNDNLIDCADSGCFADSFCGFVSGDCFGWGDNVSCVSAQLDNGQNCTWVSDPWGSWCDFPGSDCWKYDGNQTLCTGKDSCQWSDGTGSGWCEQDWSLGQDCYSHMSENDCTGGGNPDNCTWTNDTWCDGDGSDSEWCTNQGGWCDPAAFAPKQCWLYDDNETECNNQSGCYYEGSWCMEQGCWNFDSNSTACDTQSNCQWQLNEWGGECKVDWSANCFKWDENVTGCNAQESCVYRNDSMGGGWCDNVFNQCWGLTSSECALSSNCAWNSWMNACDAKCFGEDMTESGCNAISGCMWSDGYCMDTSMGGTTGGVDCWQYNDSTNCSATSECKWKSPGWCNPVGFAGGDALGGVGGGASTGLECWKYDGNQSSCTNSTLIGMSCQWMQEFRPFCEPDWSADCWKYFNETAVVDGYNCSNASGCYWHDDGQGGGWCANVFDECFMNQTLQLDNDTCNANLNCNWSTDKNQCQPSPFFATTQAACGTIANAKWMNGWCNPPGMNDMFDNMEAGAPVMIAFDNCMDEINDSYVDLCGVGLKDMDGSFGLGAGVADFSDAGICRNERVGSDFGKGNKTVKFYVYLDTDGSKTGGCALSDNSSAKGYEFFFKYISRYNETLEKATETFSALKCASGGWVAADIGLSAWKEKMCSEIDGPMIAVKKADLEKFPSLYDSEADIRVYVSTTGGAGNASSPSDTVGPGWVTPGAVDFPVGNFFELGASAATFEDILAGGGFVQHEDCFNSVDDDNDGNVDCDDWDCEFSEKCESKGVNANDYEDTSMPRITGVKVEEYPDSAMVMYNTNKPTNGTLIFWYNDSTCGAETVYNRTIYDPGVYLSTMRNYKLWHYANIYNDSGVHSLNYVLTNGTNYYYKLKICDSGGKCSVSECTKLRTSESFAKCGYCNFVTMIKAPSSWEVSYDLNTNGTYEHVQGEVCGPKAGMKTNYSSGRKANIKLGRSDGSVYFEFLNVTLTKTGLTANTRKISESSDLIYDTSEGFVGMPAATRDKIINNLHPEVCRIKIPKASDGSCTTLYHCDDNGDNCVDRTAAAGGAPIDSTNCVWQLPYCEFSTWDADGNPTAQSSSSSSSSSGGSGGGGLDTGAGLGKTYVMSQNQFKEGYRKKLKIGDRFKFTVKEEVHNVILNQLTTTAAQIEVASDPQTAALAEGDSRRFDLDSDGYYDVMVTLYDITFNGTVGEADLSVVENTDQVTLESEQEENQMEENAQGSDSTGDSDDVIIGGETGGSALLWIIIVLVVVIAGVAGYFIYRLKKNKR